MSNKESKAQGQPGAAGPSPAAEVKTAMAGFMSDIKTLHDDINSRLQQQEERLTMLDRKSLTTSRPALAAAADHDAPHQKAFEAYVRTGDDDGLLRPAEIAALDLRFDLTVLAACRSAGRGRGRPRLRLAHRLVPGRRLAGGARQPVGRRRRGERRRCCCARPRGWLRFRLDDGRSRRKRSHPGVIRASPAGGARPATSPAHERSTPTEYQSPRPPRTPRVHSIGCAHPAS